MLASTGLAFQKLKVDRQSRRAAQDSQEADSKARGRLEIEEVDTRVRDVSGQQR